MCTGQPARLERCGADFAFGLVLGLDPGTDSTAVAGVTGAVVATFPGGGEPSAVKSAFCSANVAGSGTGGGVGAGIDPGAGSDTCLVIHFPVFLVDRGLLPGE